MQNWGGSVYKDNIIYLHVLENTPEIILPGLAVSIILAEALTGGEVVFRADAGKWILDISGCLHEGHIIVKITTDALINDVAVMKQYEGSVASNCRVAASSTLAPHFAAENAVDSRHNTFWAHSLEDNDSWFEVDLGGPKAINRAELHLKLDNVCYGAMMPFDMYYEDSGDRWSKLFSSQVFGEFWAQRFDPVIARKVKLIINAPGIRFFGLYSK